MSNAALTFELSEGEARQLYAELQALNITHEQLIVQDPPPIIWDMREYLALLYEEASERAERLAE